jgi:formate-dependent nitrite reductase membrane component NrfD
MFSQSIVWYLFFAGVGGGTSFVAFVLDSYLRRFKPWLFKQYRTLIAPAHFMALVLVAVGTIFLVFDLGRPDRLLILLTDPEPTILTGGAWSLALFLLLTALQLLVRLRFADATPKTVHIIIRWLTAVAAFAVMLYTGLLLQSLSAVHFWRSPLLPVLLVLSSLSGGIAALLILGFCKQPDDLPLKPLARLINVHLPVLVLEFATLIAFIALATRSDPVAAASAARLLTGSLALLFWGGVVLAGFVAPLIIELIARRHTTWTTASLYGLVLLVGTLALRYCIIAAGMHPVTQFQPPPLL